MCELLPVEVLRDEADPVLEFEAALEEAARALDLEPWVLQRLKHPEREITLHLPIVRDDGSALHVTGYRIQHSRAHGPCIGPLTLSPTAHPALLRATALQYTVQSALLGLRLGGAAGAIVVDPDQVSERELRHMVKDYVVALHENSGPLRDVLACDVNEYVATWMDEANTHARGQSEPAAVVGRPGTGVGLDRAWAQATCELIKQGLNIEKLAGVRIALQGFGRHGSALATVLHLEGAMLVAVADRSGGLIQESGINLLALAEHVTAANVVFGFASADPCGNTEVLESDCDVLVLAAAPRQIAGHNGARIRATLVVELADGAVTESGEKALPASCVRVPYSIAGATRLAIWSHEWQRGLSYSSPEPQQAAAEATALVTHTFDRARSIAHERKTTVRNAALTLALSRLASTLRLR